MLRVRDGVRWRGQVGIVDTTSPRGGRSSFIIDDEGAADKTDIPVDEVELVEVAVALGTDDTDTGADGKRPDHGDGGLLGGQAQGRE